jgi:arginine utilization protein RocB
MWQLTLSKSLIYQNIAASTSIFQNFPGNILFLSVPDEEADSLEI